MYIQKTKKKFLYTILTATTLLTCSTGRLFAEEEIVVVENAVPGASVPAQTFFMYAKGPIKIEKNPDSVLPLNQYTVTIPGVGNIQGMGAQGKQTSYTSLTFLPLWRPSDSNKVVVSNIAISPDMVMMLSSPIPVGESTLQFSGAFLEDERTGETIIPAALKTSGVMKVEDFGPLMLTVPSEIDIPPAKLHSVNAGGEIKALKVGKDDKGPYVEITFPREKIPEFESQPYTAVVPGSRLEKVARDLNARLKDSVLDLMGNGFSFVSSLRPTFVKAIGKQTLRVGVDPAQLDVLSYYEKVHAEQVKAHGGEFTGALALFADYSAKKEETFVLFAQKGVTLKRGAPKPGTDKYLYTVTFHNVDKVVGVDKRGGQKEYTDGDIAKIIGGGKHPFKPNGMFLISPSYNGKPQPVILSFDKATLDPETRDITFEVDFLKTMVSHMGMHADMNLVPHQFMTDEPVTVKGPLSVYLDSVLFHTGAI